MEDQGWSVQQRFTQDKKARQAGPGNFSVSESASWADLIGHSSFRAKRENGAKAKTYSNVPTPGTQRLKI
jgi:hypothetical protein